MIYEISEQVQQNIITFLDRVQIQGLREISAMNEILAVINNPIKEDTGNDTREA